MNILHLFISSLLWVTGSFGADYTETLKVEKTVASSPGITVIVSNVFGNIHVSKGTQDHVYYQVTQHYKAATEDLLQAAKQEVRLGTIERNDTLVLFLKSRCICDRWNDCPEDGHRYQACDEQYEWTFDYELRVPSTARVNVQTVDRGNVWVEGIAGELIAANVTGDVEITGASRLIKASTVTGRLDVTYDGQPAIDAEFGNISGSINLYCHAELNAEVTAKTMIGALYSAFDFDPAAPTLVKTTHSKGGGTEYKVEAPLGIQIGKGGPSLALETISGNIYLRKL